MASSTLAIQADNEGVNQIECVHIEWRTKMNYWEGKVIDNARVYYLGTIILDILNLFDTAGAPEVEKRDGEYVSSWSFVDIEEGLVWLIAGSSEEPLWNGSTVASKVMSWDLYGQSSDHDDLCSLSHLIFTSVDSPDPNSFIELNTTT